MVYYLLYIFYILHIYIIYIPKKFMLMCKIDLLFSFVVLSMPGLGIKIMLLNELRHTLLFFMLCGIICESLEIFASWICGWIWWWNYLVMELSLTADPISLIVVDYLGTLSVLLSVLFWLCHLVSPFLKINITEE